ncbi:MAG: pyridoxal phosphate-dependent aminotransferase [Candidatus Eiseniibacteriota bacterium]
MQLSRLAQDAKISGTLAIDEQYQIRKSAGEDVISLGAGQPDFPTVEAGAKAGIEAIETGRTRYTPVAGTPELRAAIARKFKVENDLAVTANQVVVTSGAKQAIYHALLALVDPGERVLVPQPAWPSYVEMVRLVGAEPAPIKLDASEGYKLTVERLVKALGRLPRRSGVLILNQPANPTGATYTRDELARIAEVVRGEDLFVIADEIYEHLSFDEPFTSFATLPGMRARTITVNGFSKAFSMTGWRVGYAIGPAPVMRAMIAIQSHTSGNAASISQHAALKALEAALEGGQGRAPLVRMQNAFKRRREIVSKLLDTIPGVRYVRPGGAFYFFIDVSAHYGKPLKDGRIVRDSVALAVYLLESAGVAVVPGEAFGDDRCIRISFAASAEDLTVALKRIGKALDPAAQA